jgi:hypothetical protein
MPLWDVGDFTCSIRIHVFINKLKYKKVRNVKKVQLHPLLKQGINVGLREQISSFMFSEKYALCRHHNFQRFPMQVHKPFE